MYVFDVYRIWLVRVGVVSAYLGVHLQCNRVLRRASLLQQRDLIISLPILKADPSFEVRSVPSNGGAGDDDIVEVSLVLTFK